MGAHLERPNGSTQMMLPSSPGFVFGIAMILSPAGMEYMTFVLSARIWI